MGSWDGNVWSWGLDVQNRLAGRVRTELECLMEELSHVDLRKDGKDKWVWSDSKDGVYSVSSMRSKIEDSLLHGTSRDETFWSALVPKKICVFPWRLDYLRLPVRINLIDKGIDLPSVLCPRCNGCVEQVSHAIFECPDVQVLWSWIHDWWGLPYVGGSSLADLESQAETKLNKNSLYLWSLVIRTGAYFIWQNRNYWVFNGNNIHLDGVFWDVRISLFQWIKGRRKVGRSYLGHRGLPPHTRWISYDSFQRRSCVHTCNYLH